MLTRAKHLIIQKQPLLSLYDSKGIEFRRNNEQIVVQEKISRHWLMTGFPALKKLTTFDHLEERILKVPTGLEKFIQFSSLETLKSLRKLRIVYSCVYLATGNSRKFLGIPVKWFTIRMGREIQELLQRDNRSLRINSLRF